MENYQERALELYINNIKTKMPEIKEFELSIIESAFISGYNMGIFENEDDLMKTLALSTVGL